MSLLLTPAKAESADGLANRHIRRLRLTLSIAALLAATHGLPANSQPIKSGKIGQLLYESNCQSCHLAQADWRNKRLVNDWVSLKTEIKRWQVNLGLRWDDDQVHQVALYLNHRYYKLAAPRTD